MSAKHVQYARVNRFVITGIAMPEDAQIVHFEIEAGYPTIYFISPENKPCEKIMIFSTVQSYINLSDDHRYVASAYDHERKEMIHLFIEIK